MEAIFAGTEISLPAAKSARSLMIVDWMLVPRKAADDSVMDQL
jgi:hypothetical protein